MISGVKEILNIANEEDRVKLEEGSEEIDAVKENKLMRETIADLKRTAKKKNLISLAAPEIGINKRMFIINWQDQEAKAYINPVIQSGDGMSLSREKSNVVGDKEYILPRSSKVVIYYQTALGKVEHKEFIGVAAYLIQQNLHLLDGIFISDIGLEVLPEFDEATNEEREEVISAYLDSLDVAKKDIDEILSKQEDYQNFMTQVKYLQGIRSGEIELMGLHEDELANKKEEVGETKDPE